MLENVYEGLNVIIQSVFLRIVPDLRVSLEKLSVIFFLLQSFYERVLIAGGYGDIWGNFPVRSW